MSLSVLNQVVTCFCGNDIVITVGGDEKVNTEYAEKWFVTVDVKAMNKRKDCCHNRLNMSFNNMMVGVQMFCEMRGHPIEVTVNHSVVNE